MIKIFAKALGWKESAIDEIVDNLVSYDSWLQPAFDACLEDQTVDETIKVEGMSIADIMKKSRGMFLEALARMSIFLKDPEAAKSFASLPDDAFTYDEIVFGE